MSHELKVKSAQKPPEVFLNSCHHSHVIALVDDRTSVQTFDLTLVIILPVKIRHTSEPMGT